MNRHLYRAAAILAALAILIATVPFVLPTRAAAFTSTFDTMSRLKVSTASDHVIRTTLPLSFNFSGSSTTSDMLMYDFPSGFSISASGTWAVADFAFNDGTARAINAVSQGNGVEDVACVSGANNVGIAVDTAAKAFRVKACGAAYASSTGTSTVTFSVFGTSGNGTLTNPSSAGSQTIEMTMTDLGVAATHSTPFAVSLVEDDQITVTASVDASLAFDIDIQNGCGAESASPYTVSLGTLTEAAINTSDSHICLDLDTNATGGALVTVRGSGTADALESAATGGTLGTEYVSGAGGVTTLTAGINGYGLCVAAINAVTGSATAVAPYNGNCTTAGGSRIGGVDSAAQQSIVTTNGAPIDGTAHSTADILVKAAVSGATAEANDYTDVLTFIATSTF